MLRGSTQWDKLTATASCLRGGRGGVLRDPVSTNVSFPRREGGVGGGRDLFKATLLPALCLAAPGLWLSQTTVWAWESSC